nr:MAG TPA: hypothetical protein [Crassvirales sp.]
MLVSIHSSCIFIDIIFTYRIIHSMKRILPIAIFSNPL